MSVVGGQEKEKKNTQIQVTKQRNKSNAHFDSLVITSLTVNWS